MSMVSPPLNLSKTAIIDDFSLPPKLSSSISYNKRTVQMSDDDDLGTPAARLRALLNRVPNHNNTPSASSSKLVSSSIYDDQESNADSEHASSIAQESVRDLFRSLRDTPEKSRAPRRRSSINFGAVEESPVKDKAKAKSSYSDDGVSMDMTSLAFNATSPAPAATSTPPSLSHTTSRRFVPHTWSQSQSPSHFNLAGGSRSNLLDLDSSMQRAMMDDSVSFGDESFARATNGLEQKTPRASTRVPLEDSYNPLPPPHIPTSTLHRSLHRRNRLEDDRKSNSSASSSSKSLQEEPSATENRKTPSPAPSPYQSSRHTTTPSVPRPSTPSTIRQEIPRPTTPSTLRPASQAGGSRSPLLTPSTSKLPVRARANSSTSQIEDDERRLRKAVSTPLPAASPPPSVSPERSPEQSPVLSSARSMSLSPVINARASSPRYSPPPTEPGASHKHSRSSMSYVSYSPASPAISSRASSPEYFPQPVEPRISPKLSRSPMHSVSYTPASPLRRSPSPPRSPASKPSIPRAIPQTPSGLSPPGSMRRRSFSPRERSPSPSLELDKSPSLPSSSGDSDMEIELPQQPQAVFAIADNQPRSAFSDDTTDADPISIGSQEPSFSSAVHSSFRSPPPDSSSERFDSFSVDAHPTTPRGIPRTPLPRTPLPPVTPAPPGAFVFPGNTPARPKHLQSNGVPIASGSGSDPEDELAQEDTNIYAHMKTPAPPGAFNATRYLNTPKHSDAAEESTGNVLPAVTPYRNMKTPRPPGGWAPTPSMHVTNTARRGRFSVRFDDTVDEPAPRTKIQLPQFENSGTEEEQSMEMTVQDTPFSPNQRHNFVAKEEEESGHNLPPIPSPTRPEGPLSPSTSRRKSRHKRNTSVRMVDAYGNEESSSPPSSPSKPKQKKRAKINMLDAMGREVIEPRSSALTRLSDSDGVVSTEDMEDRVWDEMFSRGSESSAVETTGAFSKREATKRLKWGLGNLVSDLDKLDDGSSSESPEDKRLAELLRVSEQARQARKKMESDLKQVAQHQPRARLLQDSTRSSGFHITKTVVLVFLVVQVVLFLLMLRYSNVRARALFLKQYYDLFYGDIFLFTSHYREQYLSSLSSVLPSSASIPSSNTTSGTSSSILSSLVSPFSSITLNPFKSSPLFGRHGDSVGKVTDFGLLDMLDTALRPVLSLLGTRYQGSDVDVSSWPPR